MLNKADSMKLAFKECVAETPNAFCLRRRATLCSRIFEEDGYFHLGVRSFHIQATPLSVFQVLEARSLQLMHHFEQTQLEQLLKFATHDESNSRTLHRISERKEYLLQEASREEYCSYVISAPMPHNEVDLLILDTSNENAEAYEGLSKGTVLDNGVCGFAVMPDGAGDGSRVTILMRMHGKATKTRNKRAALENVYQMCEKVIDMIHSSQQ